MVNAAFLKTGGTAEQFRAGITSAVACGWLLLHESCSYVKFTPAGAAMFRLIGIRSMCVLVRTTDSTRTSRHVRFMVPIGDILRLGWT
jgi:hypothetical protein